MRSDPAELISVGEAAFARRVRAATVPILVVFTAARCEASRALLPGLGRLAARFAGQVLVLRADVDRSPMLAEQYGVTATPTLLALQDGEELTRMVGFAPEPLVGRLFAQVLAGELAPGRLWSPVEQEFEDAVIIPLIEGWGWGYQRQVSCPRRAGTAAGRGRVDILVHAGDPSRPLTLFENKRQIASRPALQQAVEQARRYAEVFQLASFVVAAPVGMWVYRLEDGRAALARSFTSLEVAGDPPALKRTLLSNAV